jgi:CBS domain-containing protein
MMHLGAQCIGEHESMADPARMMRDLGVGSLPICGDDQRLKGIITDRDIVVRCLADGRDPASMTAADMAQGRPFVVDADADAGDVLRSMTEHRVKRMPVIDDHRLVGMISEADLARHLSDDQLAIFVESVYGRA